MTRREILKYTGLMTGAGISIPFAPAFLSSCGQSQSTVGRFHFFSENEKNYADCYADVLLPSTDTPGARDVGVIAMIDQIVGTVYTTVDKEMYRKQFQELMRYSDDLVEGTSFLAGSLEEQEDVVIQIDTGFQKKSLPEMVLHGYQNFKQQTIAYYLTSKEVGTTLLNYLPVPGAYEACIPIDDIGDRAWAL